MAAVGVGALFTWIASGGPLGGKELGNEYGWIEEEGSETGQRTKIVKIHRGNVPRQRRKVYVERREQTWNQTQTRHVYIYRN